MCQTCSNGYKNIFTTTSTCGNMEELNEENLFKKTTTEVSQYYYNFATTSSNYAGYLQSKFITYFLKHYVIVIHSLSKN